MTTASGTARGPPSSVSVRGQMSRTSKTSRAFHRRAQRAAVTIGNRDGEDTRIASGRGSAPASSLARRCAKAIMFATRPRLNDDEYRGTEIQQYRTPSISSVVYLPEI